MPENHLFIIGDMTGRLPAPDGRSPPASAKLLALEKAARGLLYVELGEARYREWRTYCDGMKQRAKLAQASPRHRRCCCSTSRPTGSTRPPQGACSS